MNYSFQDKFSKIFKMPLENYHKIAKEKYKILN